jgi:hypothetical protein
MTSEHQASRTLVKSPPELWAECSDASSLARHIGEFGEIRITRLEPETSVAWEGQHASGTVMIEPSGWGTRVTLTAWTERDEVVEQDLGHGVAEQDVGDPLDELTEAPVPEVEEETDAKVEETTAEPPSAVAAVAAPAGGLWKRLIGRTRVWFKPSIEPTPVSDEELEPPAPEPPPVAPEPPPVAPEVVEAAPEGVAPEPEPEAVVPEPQVAEPEPEAAEAQPEPAGDSLDPEVILNGALDSLGQAHHRPFSRA